MDTRVGVTGANGYIGKALVKAGAIPILSDVVQAEVLGVEIENVKPDVILHLAGKSNPDWCEDPKNKYILSSISVHGTHNVFKHASELNIPCVLMSTGQIWKGGFWESEPRHEYSKPSPPVNQYGLSKLVSENIVRDIFPDGRIIRSSYVFDAKRLAPKLGSLKAGDTLQEPTFIRRSFIYLDDMVHLLMEYCMRIREMPPILHLAGSETVSYYDFVWELACQYGYDTELVKARRTELKGAAPRPSNGGLDTSLARSLGFRIPSYVDGIKRMKNEV